MTGYAKTFDASQVYSADVLADSVKVNSALKVKYPNVNPTEGSGLPEESTCSR